MIRPFSPLAQKMQESGYSLNRLADEINSFINLNVTRYDVSNYLHRRFSRINSKKRKIIRLFFIAHKWIAAPKPKPIPTCVHCCAQYPFGKPKHRSTTLSKIKIFIARGNHKRTTKNSQ